MRTQRARPQRVRDIKLCHVRDFHFVSIFKYQITTAHTGHCTSSTRTPVTRRGVPVCGPTTRTRSHTVHILSSACGPVSAITHRSTAAIARTRTLRHWFTLYFSSVQHTLPTSSSSRHIRPRHIFTSAHTHPDTSTSVSSLLTCVSHTALPCCLSTPRAACRR